MVFFVTELGDDARHRGVGGESQFGSQLLIGWLGLEAVYVNAVGDNVNFPFRTAFVLDDVLRVMLGNGNEGVSQPCQPPIAPLNPESVIRWSESLRR